MNQARKESDSTDPLIDEVRQLRADICEAAGHDVDRLANELRKVGEEYDARRGIFSVVTSEAGARVVASWGGSSKEALGIHAIGMAHLPKHNPIKRGPNKKQPESMTSLRKALTGRTKAELVEVLLQLAESNRKFLRHLTTRFDVAAIPSELVAETHQAIIEATAFDMREMNRNFDYDSAAYDQVKRNLQRMIKTGQLRQAMELSLELMKRGSYQVEMSDEGLMTSEIEDCLGVVLSFLTKCDLPTQELITWCSAMLKADRVQFIATEELRSVRSRIQARAAQQPRQK